MISNRYSYERGIVTTSNWPPYRTTERRLIQTGEHTGVETRECCHVRQAGTRGVHHPVGRTFIRTTYRPSVDRALILTTLVKSTGGIPSVGRELLTPRFVQRTSFVRVLSGYRRSHMVRCRIRRRPSAPCGGRQLGPRWRGRYRGRRVSAANFSRISGIVGCHTHIGGRGGDTRHNDGASPAPPMVT